MGAVIDHGGCLQTELAKQLPRHFQAKLQSGDVPRLLRFLIVIFTSPSANSSDISTAVAELLGAFSQRRVAFPRCCRPA